jgi:dTDP-4-amino-4,6-dideoxygalactose transaminase
MNDKRIPAANPALNDEDIGKVLKELQTVLKSGRLILGENTRAFESEFSNYIGTKHAIAVNSCTTALQITLNFLKLKPDDEVIVPNNTFVASVNAVLFAGAKPVLTDINKDTYCIDAQLFKESMTSRTKAAIIVHIGGLVCPDIDEIRDICTKEGIYLIEDCAHAHGASIDGKKAGSLSDAGCFSFYPTKILTSGTGGMITTDNDELAEYARSVRHHGQGKNLEDIQNLGNDWVMNELSAVLGRYNFSKLDEYVRNRNEAVSYYLRNLTDLPLKFNQYPENIVHSFYKFIMLADKDIDIPTLKATMLDKYGIECGSLYYPPVHLQPVFRRLFGYKIGDFPVCEDVLRRQLCLPLFSNITKSQIDYVIECLKKEIMS